MSITHVRITAPQTAGEARGHIGTIALALNAAHGEALARALRATDEDSMIRAWADARAILEAQASVTAIELYLHNEELLERAPKEGPAR